MKYRIIVEDTYYVPQVLRWWGWQKLRKWDGMSGCIERSHAERMIDQHAAPTAYVPQAWQRGSAV